MWLLYSNSLKKLKHSTVSGYKIHEKNMTTTNRYILIFSISCVDQKSKEPENKYFKWFDEEIEEK